MFRATPCSSAGEKWYEYNIWYNHCVLVVVRYRTATNTQWLHQMLYSYNYPPDEEHIVARNM
jgi:hypothetical protein